MFTVDATAYLSAVVAFAVVVLVVLLFLNRRWCYSAVFGRKCCDDILAVNARAPGVGLDHAQIGMFQTISSCIYLKNWELFLCTYMWFKKSLLLKVD